jgi:hypothetical protein
MAHFYRLDKKVVVDTVTDIPEKDWKKKNILPYEEVVIKVLEGETNLIKEGLVVGDKLVVKNIIQYYKEPTLDEYKEQKYDLIKMQGSGFILQKYSLPQQSSAALGFYPEEENQEIITFCKTNFDKIRTLGVQIRAANSKEEVDSYNWEK